MKIFFDEDNGHRLPRALRLVKMPAEAIESPYRTTIPEIRPGTKDRDWIPWAGDNGWLVFSQNYHMLQNHEEFELLLRHKVGIVFTKQGNYRTWEVLRIVVDRWDWLQQIDRHGERPFAFLIGLDRRPRQYDLSLGPMPFRRAP